MGFVLTIDQGTSSTRSLVMDESGNIRSSFQLEHEQIFPNPAWVEHNPLEIIENVRHTSAKALQNVNLDWGDVDVIGITNQRETVIAWDKQTGKPLYNAIVWQCRRTAPIVQNLKEEGFDEVFLKKTGLVLDAYFSGTKMKWMIENVPKVKTALGKGTLQFGTIDSWLIYSLTGSHTTDASNASRTLLYNIHSGDWDEELCEILGVPIETLPKVVPNKSESFGILEQNGSQVPITGVLGDQQAALFGHGAFETGNIKCTYGTGNFVLMNTGSTPVSSNKGLLTTVGWQIENKLTYALEGSVFVTGAALLWLRDKLGLIKDYSEIDGLAEGANKNGSVFFVPAFVGLGAPHWDSTARGMIIGLTRDSGKEDIVYSTLESIAYQTDDLLKIMAEEAKINLNELRVDGGITNSNLLMQRQADISRLDVVIPSNLETTAFGAGLMAGLGHLWDSIDEIRKLNPAEKRYKPKSKLEDEEARKIFWKKAVEKSQNWIEF
ncbi:MAG: glycerol kinase [Methanobacteriota archaeon]|nr:MAG: glycerol kinase [Euryarchaeota archaeon]